MLIDVDSIVRETEHELRARNLGAVGESAALVREGDQFRFTHEAHFRHHFHYRSSSEKCKVENEELKLILKAKDQLIKWVCRYQ